MPIYLLKAIEQVDFDSFAGKVIRAQTEEEARTMANEWVGFEGHIWTDPNKTTCEEIKEGDSEVLLESYNAG